MCAEASRGPRGISPDLSILANPNVVDSDDGDVSGFSSDNSKVGEIIDYPGNRQSSSLAQETCSASMQSVRKIFEQQKISEKSVSIIMRSWRQSTQKQYSTFIKRWISFCGERQTSTFHTSLNLILDFLTSLYESGVGYSALNTARSALSAVGIIIDGFSVGSHPIVIRYMKGVFNERPSLPRYSETWDVSLVLKYLQKLSPVKDLSLKLLTFKLAMLISLTLACRTQSIHLLDIRGLSKRKDSFILLYSNVLKHSKPGKDNPMAILRAYPPDRRLCVVYALKEYLNRTEQLRNGYTSLFISYMKPHKPVTRETISRWLRTVMCSAGINCEQFKTHSIRGAAVSKAKVNCVPVY